MQKMCPKILGDYECKKKPNGGLKGEGGEGLTLFFTNFDKNYYFFVLKNFRKSILRYVKNVSQSIRELRVPEPTLMGGPKGMGEGNCASSNTYFGTYAVAVHWWL